MIRSRYETATDSRVSLSLSRIYALLSAERRIYLMLFKVAESLLHVSALTLTHGGALSHPTTVHSLSFHSLSFTLETYSNQKTIELQQRRGNDGH